MKNYVDLRQSAILIVRNVRVAKKVLACCSSMVLDFNSNVCNTKLDVYKFHIQLTRTLPICILYQYLRILFQKRSKLCIFMYFQLHIKEKRNEM